MNLKELSDRITKDCDAACKEILKDEKPRTYLGASQAGDHCMRKVWFEYRWFDTSFVPEGRLLRLFDRGNNEEYRVYRWLSAMGCRLDILDSDGEQHRASAIRGHLGGGTDGVVWLPESYGWPHPMILEIKTTTKKDLPALKKHGMMVQKPQHYDQTGIYARIIGQKLGIKINHSLYIAVAKDTDEIYFEIVPIVEATVDITLDIAKQLIYSTTVPGGCASKPKIPSYYYCKSMCSFQTICLGMKEPSKNCRSCIYASASSAHNDGQWLCAKANGAVIPKDFMYDGCSQWEPFKIP